MLGKMVRRGNGSGIWTVIGSGIGSGMAVGMGVQSKMI